MLSLSPDVRSERGLLKPSKRHVDKPLYQPGCSTGCSTWSRETSGNHFIIYVLPANQRFLRADERTRTAYPCSLRVCGQGLLGVAGVCKFRISKPFLVPCIAHYCRVLRAG